MQQKVPITWWHAPSRTCSHVRESVANQRRWQGGGGSGGSVTPRRSTYRYVHYVWLRMRGKGTLVLATSFYLRIMYTNLRSSMACTSAKSLQLRKNFGLHGHYQTKRGEGENNGTADGDDSSRPSVEKLQVESFSSVYRNRREYVDGKTCSPAGSSFKWISLQQHEKSDSTMWTKCWKRTNPFLNITAPQKRKMCKYHVSVPLTEITPVALA